MNAVPVLITQGGSQMASPLSFVPCHVAQSRLYSPYLSPQTMIFDTISVPLVFQTIEEARRAIED